MSKSTINTTRNAIAKRLKNADAYVMILEKDGIVRMHTDINDAQILADTLMTFASEVIGKYEEYQKTVIAAQKEALDEAKQKAGIGEAESVSTEADSD